MVQEQLAKKGLMGSLQSAGLWKGCSYLQGVRGFAVVHQKPGPVAIHHHENQRQQIMGGTRYWLAKDRGTVVLSRLFNSTFYDVLLNNKRCVNAALQY